MRFLSFICLTIFGLFSQISYAELNVSDTQCVDTATAIIPLVARPKGKEKIVYSGVFSERFVQEIPCSFIYSDGLGEVFKTLDTYRGSAEHDKIIEYLAKYVFENRSSIENKTKETFNRYFNQEKVRIFGGFYEEIMGNIAFTIIDFRKEGKPVFYKLTVPEVNNTLAIAQMANFLRGESSKILEDILGEKERLPLFLEKIENLDKVNESENLAKEVELFLRSRFTSPVYFSFFDRKIFFRDEKNIDKAGYFLNIKLRKSGTKYYGFISTYAKGDNLKRSSAWVEGDITRLPEFEEDILLASLKSLATVEGIFDYGVMLGVDFLANKDETTRLFMLYFRQNLGNAAISLRLRYGTRRNNKIEEAGITEKYMTLGAANGWQFLDLRWLVADAGLGLDVGILDYAAPELASTQTLLLSYGPYIQASVVGRKNITFLSRLGLEQPLLLLDKNSAAKQMPNWYLNLSFGLGIAF